MPRKQIHRMKPLFTISTVMQLTGLTARQIRYYEEHGLICPARTAGNRRLFSFNDIERLLDVKDLIDQGVNLAGIKRILGAVEEKVSDPEVNVTDEKNKREITDDELRELLRAELAHVGRFNRFSLRQGDISRFFQ